jgi:hypothetical protein
MMDRTVFSTTGRGIEEKAIQQFKASLRGELLRLGDDEYEAARRIWNWMFDKHPGLIARCAGTADVVRAVDFARSHNLLAAVRGGVRRLTHHPRCYHFTLASAS